MKTLTAVLALMLLAGCSGMQTSGTSGTSATDDMYSGGYGPGSFNDPNSPFYYARE